MQLLNREAVKIENRGRSLVVVIAESNGSIRRLVADDLKQDGHTILTCGDCHEIDQALIKQTPDLLVFGTLTEISYLESYRKYSSQDLPIILLTSEPNINKFFRDWAISKGVNDVLSSSPLHLALLRDKLQEIVHSLEEPPKQVIEVTTLTPESSSEILIPESVPAAETQTITHQQALSTLNQITDFSKKYFGEMVLGNYWRKAHSASVSEHPWLECWSVNYNGVISYFSEDIPDEELTSDQFQSLKLWVNRFIKECDRIIGEYVEILQESDLPSLVHLIISPN
jgi:CheY-like chemotaxis protein